VYNKGGKIYLNIRFGDIFYAILNPTIGSEQNGVRPVIIVQNNKGNRYSPTTIVVPITSKLSKRALPTHIILENTEGLETKSMALIEQIRTLDKSRLLTRITRVNDKDLEKVKEAIKNNLNIRGLKLF
jgi:mRNA interferase MazF